LFEKKKNWVDGRGWDFAHSVVECCNVRDHGSRFGGPMGFGFVGGKQEPFKAGHPCFGKSAMGTATARFVRSSMKRAKKFRGRLC